MTDRDIFIVEDTPAPAAVQTKADWEQLLEDIQYLLDTGDFEWAEETLTGIRDTVASQRRCTPNQQQAIDNISGARD